MHIAIATAAALPTLDDDGPALLAALEAVGCTAEPAVWTDATIDWVRFDAVLIRSTWDYAQQRDRFLAWVDAVAAHTQVLNPPNVLRWNTDKRYLGALEGVPVVPTEYLDPGEEFTAPDEPFVVKPTVSAGSIDTARYAADDARAAELVARIHASGRTVMVQPYLDGVDDGETALIFFGGTFSHAIRKGPMLKLDDDLETALFRPEVIDPREASAPERAVAAQVLSAMPYDAESMAYARVDLIPTLDGPVLLELELTEPSLFLGYSEDAADRFAATVVELIERSSPS